MIELEGLGKSFRRARVLDALSLTIGHGERVALVGSNGAGKTTLIRCLLGEYRFEGRIAIDGRCPRSERTAVLAATGFVPQLPPPLKMPVGELIRFSAGVGRADPARIEALAERMGLDLAAVRRRPFVKLSGGQKQKLLIAVALGRKTDLLIMDEPAANLDPPARRVLFELLDEWEGGTMIVSSHRLDEVAALVTRVVELDGGRVVLDDRVEDAVDLSSVLRCRVDLTRPDAAFGRAIAAWSFRDADGDGLAWEGEVSGPDRLRFLGLLARYAGVIRALQLRENAAGGGEVARAQQA